MTDKEQLERIDALTRELARVVRCHVDSLTSDDAMLIGTMATSAVFALSLHTGLSKHHGRDPTKECSPETLVGSALRAPWGRAVEAALDLAEEGLTC
jgi:hypothetical protein